MKRQVNIWSLIIGRKKKQCESCLRKNKGSLLESQPHSNFWLFLPFWFSVKSWQRKNSHQRLKSLLLFFSLLWFSVHNLMCGLHHYTLNWFHFLQCKGLKLVAPGQDSVCKHDLHDLHNILAIREYIISIWNVYATCLALSPFICNADLMFLLLNPSYSWLSNSWLFLSDNRKLREYEKLEETSEVMESKLSPKPEIVFSASLTDALPNSA